MLLFYLFLFHPSTWLSNIDAELCTRAYICVLAAGFGCQKLLSPFAKLLEGCFQCFAKKYANFVALSTIEVEYVVASTCCAQLLRMRQALRDLGCK
jgi:hypothetical protein